MLLLVVGISRADPAYYYAPGYGYQADYAAIDYANIQVKNITYHYTIEILSAP